MLPGKPLDSMKAPLLLVLLLFPLLIQNVPADEQQPPNVVLFYADDWRFDVLGALGHPVVKTPNLDKLAERGVLFTNKYVTTSICGISRANLFTGQWMSRHGARAFVMFDTPWDQTYPGLLRANGYHVAHVGKWHNGPFPRQHFDFGRSYHGRHWYDDGESGRIHMTRRNENDALEYLRNRPEDQPFYLFVSFFAPHAEDGHPDQFLPQPESMEWYQDVEIPVPDTATQEAWERLPDLFDEGNEGRRRWHWRFDTPEKYQTMMRNYYRLITEVDHTCGVILAELEAQGVRDNTIVIFTTDNGYYHAEHGLADKWYPHEESIRVPLIIDDPRMPDEKRGTVEEAMVLSVDIAPTILGAAGIAAPERMQGVDMAQLYLGGPRPEWRTEFFYEHPIFANGRIPPSEALVRTDWKYFYWPDHDVEQLFHLERDPGEQNDLANNPEYAERLAEMRARFQELKEAAK